ncbi:MAG: LptF/LptG family permease [Chlorobiaceae bacterium]|jgi:lipopolysaccharide export system permease protein|nr:LptF/LptG family permease [Chlorobiaceae bacterium]
MKIIDRYILKSLTGPFLFSFLTIVFVLALQFLASFADRFMGKGIGFGDIAELVALQSAWMVVFAVPMAVLVSVIMVYGAMTNASEITVLRSSGLSLFRLALPVLIAATVLSFFVERFNNVVIPHANYRSKTLMADIVRAKPAFGLTENAFSSFIDGYSIFVGDTDESSRELRGVLLYDLTRQGFRNMVSAEKGVIDFSSDDRFLVMTLYNGEIHSLQLPGDGRYRTMSFDRHRMVFESSGFGFSRTTEGRMRNDIRELSAEELFFAAKALKRELGSREKSGSSLQEKGLSASESGIDLSKNSGIGGSGDQALREIKRLDEQYKEYNRYMTEYHKKYALPLACFAFALVGVPLGVLARRGGFGVGAGLSLLFFVFYWAVIITGEKFAERGSLDPAISIWSADFLVAFAGVLLLIRLNGVAGGSGR